MWPVVPSVSVWWLVVASICMHGLSLLLFACGKLFMSLVISYVRVWLIVAFVCVLLVIAFISE